MKHPTAKQTPADPGNERQRKSDFTQAAHDYGQVYSWRIDKDPRHTEKGYRLGTRDLLTTASNLLEESDKENATTESQDNDKRVSVLSHLLAIAQEYRKDPSKRNRTRLMAVAVSWHREEQHRQQEEKEDPKRSHYGEALHHTMQARKNPIRPKLPRTPNKRTQ